jgi:hypothetical protein
MQWSTLENWDRDGIDLRFLGSCFKDSYSHLLFVFLAVRVILNTSLAIKNL